MKASFYRGNRTFETGTVPMPQPADGEALLRVRRVGICGTDLHIFQGHLDHRVPRGGIIGHETFAEVVTRTGVERLRGRRPRGRRARPVLRHVPRLPDGCDLPLLQPEGAGRGCHRRDAGVLGGARRAAAEASRRHFRSRRRAHRAAGGRDARRGEGGGQARRSRRRLRRRTDRHADRARQPAPRRRGESRRDQSRTASRC